MKFKVLSFFFVFYCLVGSAQQTVGTLVLEDEVSSGYVLLAPVNTGRTYLIDNCGKKVNTWYSDYMPGLSGYLDKEGNLWRTGRVQGAFTGGGLGGIIEKFSWDETLIGAYQIADDQKHQHHDFHVKDDGNILLIAWEKVSVDEFIDLGRDPAQLNTDEIWQPLILEIKPTGFSDYEIVWEWRQLDHIIQDFDPSLPDFGDPRDFPERMDINVMDVGGSRDWLHFNSIHYREDHQQILVSSAFASEIYVIDRSTTVQEAAGHSGGVQNKGGDFLYRWGNPTNYREEGDKVFYFLHNARWIESNGQYRNILVFNNGEESPDGNVSRVEEIETVIQNDGSYLKNPEEAFLPQEVAWDYGLDNGIKFYSSTMSGAKRLSNGNTIFTIGETGEIFEVDSDDEIVWQYHVPLNYALPVAQGEMPIGNAVFFADRYLEDFQGFVGKEFNDLGYIELNGAQSLCGLVGSDDLLASEEWVKLKYHASLLSINLTNTKVTHCQVVTLNGTIVKQIVFEENVELDMSMLNSGLYILKLLQNDNTYSHKFVKF